jgi:hypothetical protein
MVRTLRLARAAGRSRRVIASLSVVVDARFGVEAPSWGRAH